MVPPARAANSFRIIGGEWRGRRLQFAPVPGLRPTPDRVRETLFNWLQPVIHGARCLDLFAGSGALGFEAASRGASRVVLVDADPRVVKALGTACARLGADFVEPVRADAAAFLRRAPEPFDLVMLDPPYSAGLLLPALEALAGGAWLSAHARVYIEFPHHQGLPEVLPRWQVHRQGNAGAAGYALLSAAPEAVAAG